MLLSISIKLSLNMELESVGFDGIENCFHRPHEILIPQEITRVEGEICTRLDELSRCGMHPVNKKVSHILDVSQFSTGSKNMNSKHVMQLGLMEFVIKGLVDVQDVHSSQDCTIVVLGSHEVFKVDVFVATTLWYSRNKLFIENALLLVV